MTVGPAGDTRLATGLGTGTEYVALIRSDGNEVSGGGYSRQTVQMVQSTEQGNTDRAVNQAEVDFGTASANWGTINQIRLYTSSTSTAASALIFSDTIPSITINAQDTVSIAAGNLSIAFV